MVTFPLLLHSLALEHKIDVNHLILQIGSKQRI